MAYTLCALVGPRDVLPAGAVPLASQELFLLPCFGPTWRERVGGRQPLVGAVEAGARAPEERDEWDERNIQGEKLLHKLLGFMSLRGPVAYVEAVFWAGSGDQASLVYQDGELVLASVATGRDINAALAALGVSGDSLRDEFEVAGLGENRSTHRWAKEERVEPALANLFNALVA